MRIQRFIFVIIVKASLLVIRSAVRAFTDKFCQSMNRFFQVALYFLLLILKVDSYFVLFIRLCFSAQECAHLMGKILLGVGSTEIGMSTNIVPITLQIALIVFSRLVILSKLKMPVNLSKYCRTVVTFNNRNYYHKLTLSLGQPCQSTFFLNCVFPLCNISFLFVLLITVFLTLKSNS